MVISVDVKWSNINNMEEKIQLVGKTKTIIFGLFKLKFLGKKDKYLKFSIVIFSFQLKKGKESFFSFCGKLFEFSLIVQHIFLSCSLVHLNQESGDSSSFSMYQMNSNYRFRAMMVRKFKSIVQIWKVSTFLEKFRKFTRIS